MTGCINLISGIGGGSLSLLSPESPEAGRKVFITIEKFRKIGDFRQNGILFNLQRFSRMRCGFGGFGIFGFWHRGVL